VVFKGSANWNEYLPVDIRNLISEGKVENYFMAGGEGSLTTFAGVLAYLPMYPMNKMYFKAYMDT
jgi:hypothetical protein